MLIIRKTIHKISIQIQTFKLSKKVEYEEEFLPFSYSELYYKTFSF